MDERWEDYDWAGEYDPGQIPGPNDRPRRRRRPPRHIERKLPAPLGDLAGLTIIAAAHDAERTYADALEPFGMSRHELAAMAVIAAMEGVSMQALAERLGVSTPVASEAVKRLVALGAARRSVDPHDRRRVIVDPTEAGYRTFLKALDAVRRADAVLATRMAVFDRAQLTRLLERLLAPR